MSGDGNEPIGELLSRVQSEIRVEQERETRLHVGVLRRRWQTLDDTMTGLTGPSRSDREVGSSSAPRLLLRGLSVYRHPAPLANRQDVMVPEQRCRDC
jgi:hypothetical protein